ncbi:MAG: 50S ribosomal protein L23 [Desulfamplus sp.]|nr:50S ribosomal protein L23 [Desulfamplus sp.]MBF0241231.1 50S ribosomal protein L23 [Desulfamplus sp.]
MIEYDIIRKPIQSEKSNVQKERSNQLTFEVAPSANRVEIKNAIEKIFNTKVKSVNTINVKGKLKRRGRILGKRRDWKKAIVRLMPGQRIDFFEGV